MSSYRVWNWAAIALVGWGALVLGSTTPEGYFLLLAGIAIYGAASFATRVGPFRMGRGLCFAPALLCGAIFLQLLPLPVKVLSAISPATVLIAEDQRVASPAVEQVRPDRRPQSRPISIDSGSTALGLAFVMALGLFFIGTVRTLGRGGDRRLAAGLVGLGTIVALIGIAETITSWGGLYEALGIPSPPDSTPHGPFSSRNHYAGWMLMALALTIGYLGGSLEQAGLLGSSRGPSSGRVSIARILVLQIAVAVMTVALIQTKSRAGILCLALALVTLGCFVLRHTSVKSRMLIAGPLVLLTLVGVGVTGVQPIVERFAADSWFTAHGRLSIWRQATEIIWDFPVTGSGFNTYRAVVPFYFAADVGVPYEGAHNDFLQLAAEGGVLVGLPALATVAFFVRETRQRFREAADDAVTRWLRVGAVVGLSVMFVQETVDFSLQVPGNAVLFVALAAIAAHRAPLEARRRAQWR